MRRVLCLLAALAVVATMGSAASAAWVVIGSGAAGSVSSGTWAEPPAATDATWIAYNSALGQWQPEDADPRVDTVSTAVAGSADPMLVLDTGSADVALTVPVTGGGIALYARVADGSHWIRVRVDRATNSGSVAPVYNDWDETVTIHHHDYVKFHCSEYDSDGGCYAGYAVYNDYDTTSTVHHHDLVSSGYSYSYDVDTLILEADVSGTITNLGSYDLGGTLPAYLGLTATGTSVTASYGLSPDALSTAITATAPPALSGTQHGAGLAASTSAGVSSLGVVTMTNP